MLKREIWSGVEIEAPAERVWEILSDLDGYPAWNPYIVRAHGALHPHGRLRVTIKPEGRKPTTSKPRILHFERGRLIAWHGHVGVPGILDETHVIEVEPVDTHRTRVVQRGRFRGALVPFVRRTLTDTENGFKAMNEALAERAEERMAA